MSKDKLYELIDALPESKVDTAGDFLAYLVDRERSRQIMNVLENAPEEDQAPDVEELQALKEAKEDIRACGVRPYADTPSEEEIAEDWLIGAQRRARELDEGIAQSVSAEEVRRKAQALLR